MVAGKKMFEMACSFRDLLDLTLNTKLQRLKKVFDFDTLKK